MKKAIKIMVAAVAVAGVLTFSSCNSDTSSDMKKAIIMANGKSVVYDIKDFYHVSNAIMHITLSDDTTIYIHAENVIIVDSTDEMFLKLHTKELSE